MDEVRKVGAQGALSEPTKRRTLPSNSAPWILVLDFEALELQDEFLVFWSLVSGISLTSKGECGPGP